MKVQSKTQLSTRVRQRFSVAVVCALATVGGLVTPVATEIAEAGFYDCAQGQACVWTGSNYTSTKYTSTSAGGCINNCTGAKIKSYANRIAGRRVQLYRDDVRVLVDMCSNCGNSNRNWYTVIFTKVYKP